MPRGFGPRRDVCSCLGQYDRNWRMWISFVEGGGGGGGVVVGSRWIP